MTLEFLPWYNVITSQQFFLPWNILDIRDSIFLINISSVGIKPFDLDIWPIFFLKLTLVINIRAFILHMSISRDKIFLLVSRYLSLWPWPHLELAIIGPFCFTNTSCLRLRSFAAGINRLCHRRGETMYDFDVTCNFFGNRISSFVGKAFKKLLIW